MEQVGGAGDLAAQRQLVRMEAPVDNPHQLGQGFAGFPEGLKSFFVALTDQPRNVLDGQGLTVGGLNGPGGYVILGDSLPEGRAPQGKGRGLAFVDQNLAVLHHGVAKAGAQHHAAGILRVPQRSVGDLAQNIGGGIVQEAHGQPGPLKGRQDGAAEERLKLVLHPENAVGVVKGAGEAGAGSGQRRSFPRPADDLLKSLVDFLRRFVRSGGHFAHAAGKQRALFVGNAVFQKAAAYIQHQNIASRHANINLSRQNRRTSEAGGCRSGAGSPAPRSRPDCRASPASPAPDKRRQSSGRPDGARPFHRPAGR